VADGDVQAGGRGQSGDFELPEPWALPVRSAAVGSDEQPSRVGVLGLSHLFPPLLDGGDREDGGVVIDTDGHPGAVIGDV
jgi:hypothetical protein